MKETYTIEGFEIDLPVQDPVSDFAARLNDLEIR